MAKGGIKLQLVDCVCHQYDLLTFLTKYLGYYLWETAACISVLSNIMPHNFLLCVQLTPV